MTLCPSTWCSLAVASCGPHTSNVFLILLHPFGVLKFCFLCPQLFTAYSFPSYFCKTTYSGGFSWPSALKCWKIATLICFPFCSHLHFFFLIPFTTGYSSCILIGLQIYFTYETRNSIVVGTPFCWLFMSLIPLYEYIAIIYPFNIWQILEFI